MSDAKVTQKIVFTGTLQLDSPLVIGTGTEEERRTNEADVYILKDKQERPFIPGTSLAGVLRDWLTGQNAEKANNLFGFVTKNEKAKSDVQSAVAVSDVILENSVLTIRDGVSIDVYTGTGIKGHKYDYEAVERGAKGILNMVITVREYQEKAIPNLDQLMEEIADRLYTGVRIGALTTKGFGLVRVPDITVNYYNFKVKKSVVNWLFKQPSEKQYNGKKVEESDAAAFVVDGSFSLETSLLVRHQNAAEKAGDTKINAVPMKSGDEYLIPGTSLKGVLRHQAEKILVASGMSTECLDSLMGCYDDEKKQKSRFIVNEVYFKEGVIENAQTRNRIDRFTGGTIESALFTNRALWQQQPAVPVLHIHYEIRQCKDWEAGLALFLLKDLWNGKIALGGEKSIGRGILHGISADILFNGKSYTITDNGKVARDQRDDLEKLAAAFNAKEREAAE